ncbi:MAG: tagatose 1,6-diphosphate aldolase [Chloroflexota bacterium]
MRNIELGKVRALTATANARGIFTILAVDHRDSLKVMLNPDDLSAVPASTVTQIKLDIVREVVPLASGTLIDPVYGAPQAIAAGYLPRGMGLISSIEEQGYLGDPYKPLTPMLNGWGIEKAKRMGATGVKILMKYHPDSGEIAEKQEELVRSVLAEGGRYEIPLFLEPIVYPLDPDMPYKSEAFAAQRRELVVKSAKTFSDMGVDVLKMEFPLDANFNQDEGEWVDACAELNAAVSVPWALLSAGVTHEVFRRQLQVACENGCSGFLAGRSVWREAVHLQGEARIGFLQSEARSRFQELVNIANAHGTPWKAHYQMPSVDDKWYISY